MSDRTKNSSSIYIWVLLGVSYSGTSTKGAMASLHAHNPFSKGLCGCSLASLYSEHKTLGRRRQKAESKVSKLYLSLWTKTDTALKHAR